ncbi:hypothetical protein P153DRAFT_283788 [Dothidotthia symphoricarpi CBS 119687]|uniref:Uncharacterized protein n=1 Tax=Dothidotthia symphoricarpi CBS 119687 TaxID=1392245 RepID=A0A6A6ALZ3_9PLEO|nr:uncharacterized protein P153DRAFT_283788 [Dothidotthia symphoricarpi CBS 119687]KAF2132586.1 hypothetical protein P153DRAFT_283788 [Dothidotthia symphoricarpi CBS 119687]
MSGLDPQGPSQPTLNQAYTTPGNPASKDPTEKSESEFNASDNSAIVDKRVPTKQASDAQGEANSKAPGGGIHGAPAGEEAKGKTHEDVGRHNELDGEQMAAPGEGRVADAVAKGGKGMGGGGAEPDLASDLDRKKAEQAEAREAVKQSRSDAQDGGALGQQGGPAHLIGNAQDDGYSK